MYLHEYVIKGVFSLLTLLYVYVTYGDTQAPSPLTPYRTEWDVCWQMATWYMTWHIAICLSVWPLG
ncbi:hypothetical protein BGW80DRAFT_838589 [Lactifluus volemus]|nr:hypothetical protein BGW80DRAFT_838589 [Lactifluus volemus]